MSAPNRPDHRVALALFVAASLLPGAAGATQYRSTAIDVTADGAYVWVVNPDHGSVSVLASQGNVLETEIPVGRDPWCVDLHDANDEAWVTSQRDDHVYIIDMTARAVVDSIPAGFGTFGVAFNPSGTTALVTATGSDEIFAIDVATRTVTQNLADSYTIFRRPRGIAWRSDGDRAWVTHLMHFNPENFSRVSTVFPATWTIAEIGISQVFGLDLAGYMSTMQNIAQAPPPHDDTVWLPGSVLNTTIGGRIGHPLTPTNIFHAGIFPIDANTSAAPWTDVYFMDEGWTLNQGFIEPAATPVGGPIAVEFKNGRAFVVNLHSENVTVLDDDLWNPDEIAVLPVGAAPIGIVGSPTLNRAYIANWLDRTVTVINTNTNSVMTTVDCTLSSEPLTSQLRNGKRLFHTSTGAMSLDGRGACASCHIFGTHDGRPWDLTQFGKEIRSTPDCRGIGFTGAHDWTADKDEMADHDFGILEFTGGAGLIPSPNPPLGDPNTGLSVDMDNIGQWMSTLQHRPDTPFLAPGGGLTAEADSGMVLFNDPTVGCATCHTGPFFTDSTLPMPFVKHVVGTADSTDLDAAAGFDTPSLVGAWDTAPYLHTALAKTIEEIFNANFNPDDLHGTTSQLAPEQIGFIADYVRSIGWPDSTGAPLDAPDAGPGAARDGIDRVFPNPFEESTSLRFVVDRSSSSVRIDVFDVQGRRVRSLLDRPMARGEHVVGWDSRDEAGRRVAPGVYFARLVIDDREAGHEKLTVVR